MPTPAGTLAELIDLARAAESAGDWDDALRTYEAAFARLTSEGDAATAAELLRRIGTVHYQRGEVDIAGELFEASLAVAEAEDALDHVAAALNCLAAVEQFLGGIARAEALYLRARDFAVALHDERLAAMVDQNLGTLANIRGDVDGALLRYRSALARFRRLGDDLAATWALNNMGMAFVDLGDWDAAEACYAEAFELADRLRETGTLGSIELNRAELHLERRDVAGAREHCDRAFEIFSRLDSQSGLAEAYKFYGALYRETAKPGLAEHHLALAVELAGRCGDRLLRAESESELARVHLGEGRNREALQSLNRAHRIFEELGARREILDLERRLDRLEDTYIAVVQAWGESIEAKDRYTAGHCRRVADYACLLAEAVGFTGRDLTWMRMGAFLHDVGKTAVPAEILNKPGKLTPDEWRLMQSHTTVGDEIVTDLDFPWEIRPIVRNHHEHWDGSGYPDGLAGEEIPLTARILCIADIYDALTTARSYRPALPAEEALSIMARDAGRIIDARLFEIFHPLVAESPAEPRVIPLRRAALA